MDVVEFNYYCLDIDELNTMEAKILYYAVCKYNQIYLSGDYKSHGLKRRSLNHIEDILFSLQGSSTPSPAFYKEVAEWLVKHGFQAQKKDYYWIIDFDPQLIGDHEGDENN